MEQQTLKTIACFGCFLRDFLSSGNYWVGSKCTVIITTIHEKLWCTSHGNMEYTCDTFTMEKRLYENVQLGILLPLHTKDKTECFKDS